MITFLQNVINHLLDFHLIKGYIPDFRCKVPIEYIDENYNPGKIRNATIIQQQCDVIISTNKSGIAYEDKVPCRHGYEYSGPETTASEVNVC